MLESLLEFLIQGVVLGGLYALFAVGITLIFGVLNVINVAHGEFFAVGGYVLFAAVVLLHLPPVVGAVAGGAGAFLLGLCVYPLLIAPLQRRLGRWHRQGLAVRAVAQNPEAAQAMGIDLGRIFSLTLALGVGLAGIGGALMAPLFNVYPAVGFPLTIKAFAITILGGMGNLVGALLASLIIGVAESLVVIVVPSQWQNGVAFVVMIAVLLLRPQGLLGRATAR